MDLDGAAAEVGEASPDPATDATDAANGANGSGAGSAGGAGGHRVQPPPPSKAYVLHYSRLGEPANACGSGLQYLEDLFIRVPQIADGSTFTIGQNGVIALYARRSERQDGPPSGAKKVEGTVRIVGRSGGDVNAELNIAIELPTGEMVELDDEYAFHPNE